MDGFGDLFLDQDYVECTFSFSSSLHSNGPSDCSSCSIEQKILCLRAASTDFDLTGQILWPGCHALCDYLVGSQGVDVQGLVYFLLQ
jgi:hypothetical protein